MNINQGKGYRIFSVFNILLMILICLMIIFPLYYMLIVSISDGAAIMSGQVNFLPVGFSLRAYRAAFKDANFIKSYWNTVVITACGTTVNLLMTTLFAYPLSRSDLMGRKMLMKIAVFTMFFTGGMIPSYMLVNSLGMNNTYWALILPGAINVYNATIMRTFFEGIPMDMTEAAYVDGANDVRILWQVILPLSKPICSVIAIFAINAAWSDFLLPYLVLRGSALQTVMVRLFVFSTEQTVNADTMMRSVVFSMIPPIILFFIFQKQLTENAVSVGIKG